MVNISINNSQYTKGYADGFEMNEPKQYTSDEYMQGFFDGVEQYQKLEHDVKLYSIN